MFSTTSKYALKAVLYLASNTDEQNKITANKLAGPINVPKAYIAKLLQDLSKQNIVSSTKGPKGGFYLSDKNKEQTLMKVIIALKGEESLSSCLLSLNNCNEKRPCPLHKMANPLREKLKENLNSKTVAQISNEIDQGIVFLPL